MIDRQVLLLFPWELFIPVYKGVEVRLVGSGRLLSICSTWIPAKYTLLYCLTLSEPGRQC